MGAERVDVLFVDDDEDDYLLTSELVEAIDGSPYRLSWAASYAEGLARLRSGSYAICLVDHLLDGIHTGLDFVREAVDDGIPLILITGAGSGAIERAALDAGAADYLVKGQLDVDLLSQVLRHSMYRRKARAALTERDRLFRAVFDSGLDAMLITDDQARIVDANAAAAALFRLSRQQLVETRLSALAPEGSLSRDGARIEAWPVAGAVRILEHRASADLLPGRHLSVLRDITERQQDEAIRARLAAIVASADDAIVGQDPGGVIQAWNPAAERIYGCPASGAIGAPLRRFVAAGRLEEWDALHRRLGEGERIAQLETVHQRSDGTPFEASVTLSLLRDPAGRVVGATMIARDISETNRLRSQLSIADRMASIGVLAAGVAHEINNPLAAVVAGLELIEEALEGHPDPELATTLADVTEAVCRVRDIACDLRLLSRTEDSRAPVDVVLSVRSAIRLMRYELRHRARLVDALEEVPSVDANQGRLGQVFLNLLANAVQAIPPGKAGSHEIRVSSRTERGQVVVEILDTGSGFAPEVGTRLFEPFFTTKPVGVGTGLGLSICRTIVTGLGGRISAHSAGPGRGATFRVELPIGQLARAPVAMTPLPAPPCRTRVRILVVDDEPALVRVIHAVLRREHEVVTATGGREALALIEADPRLDVILCDLMMPDVGGMELYEALLLRFPPLAERIILMTGGAFTFQAQAFLERVPNVRIYKPFEPTGLTALVRQFVSSEGGPPDAARSGPERAIRRTIAPRSIG